MSENNFNSSENADFPHSPDCDSIDDSPERIKKPCNCRTTTDLLRDGFTLRQEVAVILGISSRSSKEEWERLDRILAAVAQERVTTELQNQAEWSTLMADVHDYFKDERADRGHGRVRLVLTLLGQLRCERDDLHARCAELEENLACMTRAADGCRLDASREGARADLAEAELRGEREAHKDTILAAERYVAERDQAEHRIAGLMKLIERQDSIKIQLIDALSKTTTNLKQVSTELLSATNGPIGVFLHESYRIQERNGYIIASLTET